MRPEKQLLLNEFQEKIDESTAFVLTRYNALTPNISSQFRLHLAKAGGGFSVIRKRLLMKIAKESGINLNRGMLKGHIGVVFVRESDPVQTTKAFYEFSREHADLFEVVGGKFEGRFLGAEDVKAISILPGKDEMRAQFLSVLEAPLSHTLAVVEALLTSVLHCFENKAAKNQE